MVTLDRLINVLGGYGVHLRACTAPRSTELRSVVLPEKVGDDAVVGDVLLAVDAPSVEVAIGWAQTAHAAVVLTRDDDTSDAIDPLQRVAVMVVDPEVSWSELAVVVYGLVLEGRETSAGRGPTDLFALADSLADAVGGAVTIEDNHWQVLAYSRMQQNADEARAETILGRQAPERLRELFSARGVLKHLAVAETPLFVPAAPDHGVTGRMVVAVRAGRQVLGSVWVACSATLGEAQARALADGARMVALHMLRSRASADLERHVESELVFALFDGASDAPMVASKLALPFADLRVIALRPRVGDERHAALLLAFERATTGFGWSRPGRSALADSTVYTVLPSEPASVARRWVDDLRAALPEQMTVHAGISGTATVLELAAAREEADECLALHELGLGAEVPTYDETWDEILLQRLRIAARSGRTPHRGPVTDLRRHDRLHSTQYVETLRAWLAAQGELQQAAELLGIHENTVRYRLRKMSKVTDLDLKDAHKRLAMTIELAASVNETLHETLLSESDKLI
ncbi:MAG: helix-turn-helix domain-containing protein [Mycobacterium sp.]